MKLFKTLSALAIIGSLSIACAQEKKEKVETTNEVVQATQETVEKEQTPNIVEVAASNDSFTTLVAAVKAANLVETLGSDGPFTVFAPTNDAFAALPEGTVETLLKPENKDTLTSILTYHVVSGKFEAAAVIDAIKKNDGSFTVTTVQGEKIVLSLKDDNVMLTDAKGGMATVVMADVSAQNGVIHAINAVVMPK